MGEPGRGRAEGEGGRRTEIPNNPISFSKHIFDV